MINNPKNNGKSSLQERTAYILASINETIPTIGEKLGVNRNTITAYKKGKGDLKGVVIENLVSVYSVNPTWLLTGEGPIYKDKEPKSEKQNQTATDNDPPESCPGQGKITDLITKTIEILESNTVYSGALSANIDAFHEATRTEKKLHDIQVSMESKFKLMDRRVALLEAENKKLKDSLDYTPDNGEGLASGQN